MSTIFIREDLFLASTELRFRTSRSRGPGGQNVNKLETKVELEFDVLRSRSLTEDQRTAILSNLRTKIDAEGTLRIVSQESRSQWTNKKSAIKKLIALLQRALKTRKKRKASGPPVHAREERLYSKKRRGEKKKMRQAPKED